MNKREFLKKSFMATLGLSTLAWSQTQGASKPKNIGLQMYSLRELLAKDLATGLQLIADIGFNVLETAKYADGQFYGLPAKEFKKRTQDLGLRVTSGHISHPYKAEKKQACLDWWQQALDAQAELGCPYTIFPWINPKLSWDEVKVHSDYFNKISEIAKSRHIKFAFHNHAGEFAPREGGCIMDYLIANAAENMYIQLDVYWAQVGGVNPSNYIRKHANKIKLLHIKDETEIGASDKLDFAGIFAAAKEVGIVDWYAEIEKYGQDSAEDCVRKSYQFLNNASYVI